MSEDYKKPFIPIWMENAGLPPHQYRVLGHLWSRGQGRCFPSLETIAKCCGIKRITAINAIRELEAKGFVVRQKRKSKGIRFANEYLLKGPNGAPVKNEQVPLGHRLTGPNEAPANRSLWGTGNDTSGNDPSLNETSLFAEEDFPLAKNTPSEDCHDPFTYWQSFKELPAIKEISPKRKAKLKTRMREPFFRENWKTAIDKIKASSFLTGHGPRGWKADIDWLLAPGNVLKVIEGKYDNQPTTTGNHHQQSKATTIPNPRGSSAEKSEELPS